MQGGQSVNGGETHEGGHRPYGGGPNFDRLYHKLNVLLMLSCNYMMQFIGYDSITTDVRQPWTNYVNNGNKHLIVGADVRSEYSNIRYLHLIIGKAQKFVSGDKYDF